MSTRNTDESRKHILIIGAGFGGLAAAKALSKRNVHVTLVDRNNYHTFQPLLYQVATGGLEPDSIAYPVRRVFRRRRNVSFRMAELQAVIPSQHKIRTSIRDMTYDYLVIATGSLPNFYSFEPVAGKLMPLKTVTDALNMRSLIMQNLESATLAEDAEEQEALINVVIVGAGPTGVELAGALAEMRRHVLPKDFPELDMTRMHIYLFEGAGRVLPAMSKTASRKAERYLKRLGVILKVNSQATGYDGATLTLADGTEVNSETVIWTAGVQADTVAGLSDVMKQGMRLPVDATLRVKGYENIYAIGDIALASEESFPDGHPMLSPVAIQQGRHAARNIWNQIRGRELHPFRYRDKGVMATIGRNRAVADLSFGKFGGTLAWFIWMFIHIWSLIGFRNKLVTFIGWAYNYFTYDRALGLIIRPYRRS